MYHSILSKENIRKIYKKKRAALHPTKKKKLEQNIYNLLFNQFDFKAKFIHTFLPIKGQSEIDTTLINQTFFDLGATLATSITLHNPLALTHSIITPQTTYELDAYKIPTPIQQIPLDLNKLDFVIIPLLAFDNKGNRIGYGKGLYDSFLCHCPSTCIKIGLSFFEALPNSIPKEKHDINLDFCITPTTIYNFNTI